MSIRLKLAIIFLAIGSIPLLFVSIITFRNYKSTLEAEHLEQLKNIANFKVQTIESYFAGLQINITMAQDFYNIKKNLPVLIQFVDQPTRSEFIVAKDTLDKELRTMQEVLKLSSIVLVNTEGKIVYTSNPQYYKDYFSNPLPDPGNKAFIEGKTKVYFSDVFFNKTHNNAVEMLVAAPAFDEKGSFSGVIVFEVDMTPIYRLIQEGISLGNTGEVLLGKAVGSQVVFLNPLKYDVNAALKRRVSVGQELGGPIQKAVSGEEGSGQLIDYRGQKVIAAWRYIPSLGWGMVAKVDVREAFADVINLRNLVTVILAIVLLLAGVVSFSIAQSISGPIKELSKGAVIIGSGNLDYRVGTGLKDEVGQLSRVFDKMTRDLKKTGFARDAERQRLYSVLETLPVYVVLLDKDYRVPFANKFFRERFGESGGKRCYEYLFNRSSPCENCETYKVMKTNVSYHWEWKGPDGRNYDIFDYPFIDSDGSRMIMEMGIDITEQKKAQADLAQASQYSRSLIEASLDPLVTISADGAITDVNDATVKATGIPREKLIGTEFSNYFTEPQKAKAGYQKVFAKGFVTDYPLTICHKDGTLMDVLYNASIYRDTHGNVLGVFAAARDVTLLKQTEAELRRHRDSLEVLVKERTAELQESQERLQHALDAGEFGTWGLDTTTKKAWRSLRHDQIFGYETLLPEWTYAMFLKHVLSEDRKAVDEKFGVALAKGTEWNFECRIKRTDGAIRWIWAQGKPRLNEQKSVVTLIGLIQDITERKRAQELLQKAHDELETKVLFRTQELVTLNEQLTQEISKRKETEKQINARNVMLKLLNQTVSRKAYVDGLVKLIRAWSTCVHVGIRILNEEGEIPYESHKGFDEDFLGLENSLSVKVDHCMCTHMIKGAPEPEEKPFMTKVGSFFCNDTLKFLRKLPHQAEDKFRGVCIKKGFRTLAVIPIRYGEKIVGVIHLADEMPDKIDSSSKEFIEAISGLIGEGIYKFSLEDKIEREKIQHQEQLMEAAKQLEQARRLSDIGTLAATVAHELRNPLAAINMAASNIKRKAQNPLLDKHLHNIETKVYESDQIINNLLFYSRIKPPHYENVKINSILEECAELSKRQSQAKKKMAITKKLQPTRNISIDVDPLQMKEMVCNVLNNSYDALPESGGAIEMFTNTSEKSVTICIKDNGAGIDKEFLDKVFDPFFTTKAKGTGLGLAVCRQIVNLHGGTIHMESEQGKGTSVCIVLPKKGRMLDG